MKNILRRGSLDYPSQREENLDSVFPDVDMVSMKKNLNICKIFVPRLTHPENIWRANFNLKSSD